MTEPNADAVPPAAPASALPPSSAPERRGFGWALAAMICGASSLAFVWVPYAGIVLGLAGIVLGAIALRKGQQKLMSWLGIVIGLAGIVVGALLTWAILAALG